MDDTQGPVAGYVFAIVDQTKHKILMMLQE
jgi:hypothetical protein